MSAEDHKAQEKSLILVLNPVMEKYFYISSFKSSLRISDVVGFVSKQSWLILHHIQ